ncbi:MAG TPA: tetratricopeptide repeat protein [Candidatus Limnocylindrales bacterium]|nr:tetratricopeptide repeat protein [Candidatus Limnocylindrales bacterium]
MVLAALILAAVLVYLGTYRLAASNRSIQASVGRSWFKQGRELLQTGKPDSAVKAFRKASVNDRENRQYSRWLASALEADGRNQEARELLLQIRESVPEDPEVNLELARISARQSDIPTAVRYYQNALYGIWTGEDIDRRRDNVRRELIDVLLQQGTPQQALPEILALANHLPATVANENEVGKLLLRAGAPRRALDDFQWVLRHDRHDATALAGAAQAWFEVGDYARAKRELSLISARTPEESETLKLASIIVDLDPTGPLSLAERSRRLVTALDLAGTGLAGCLNRSPASPNAAALQQSQQTIQSLKSQISAKALENQPDLVTSSMELISQSEDLISKSCGPVAGSDKALLLLAEKVRGAEQ